MASPSSTILMAPSSPVSVQRSPWHSPVPYLFGGLAAMMSLVVFALFILACSYRKLSRNLSNNVDRDLEAGAGDVKPADNNNNKIPSVLKEMYIVIMAGEEKPTFLATPSSSRTSSFGSNGCRSCSTTTSEVDSSASEMEKDERSHQVHVTTTGSHVSVEHVS